MDDWIIEQARAWTVVAMVVGVLACIVTALWRTFHPKSGAISTGLGVIIGGGLILALAGGIGFIVTQFAEDIPQGTGSVTNTPAPPATAAPGQAPGQ